MERLSRVKVVNWVAVAQMMTLFLSGESGLDIVMTFAED